MYMYVNYLLFLGIFNLVTSQADSASWSAWSLGECSVTCGEGSRSDQRSCSSSVEDDCPGSSTRISPCSPCPPCLNEDKFEENYNEGSVYYRKTKDVVAFTHSSLACTDEGLIMAPVTTQEQVDTLKTTQLADDDTVWVDLYNPSGLDIRSITANQDIDRGFFDVVDTENAGCAYVSSLSNPLGQFIRVDADFLCKGEHRVVCYIDCDAVSTTTTTTTIPTTTTASTWTAWGDWSTCSETCNHGTQQRQRSCLDNQGCDGLPVEAQYCENEATCTGLTSDVIFKQALVTSEDKDTFLEGATVKSVPEELTHISPYTFCATECAKMRTDDYTICNGFVLEDNQCKLSFMELNWILEAMQNQSNNENKGVILFEIIRSI